VDETFLVPQWSQIDDAFHADTIRSLLDDGNLWFAAMDMEIHWLSENLGTHSNLLAPDEKAIELTAKPSVKAFDGLGFEVPEFISASLPDAEIHAFLRKHAWQCWLKSPFHDAKRISNWSVFERTREYLSKNWCTSRLFLQRNVTGHEETIAFGAYKGKLISAAHLEKKQLTPEGKTWAGKVTPVKPALLEQIAEVVRRINWSGGGELEYVRDSDGQRWMIECNPRFPAWIYGAALAGMNLPAQLLSHVWNLPVPLESVSDFPLFTRVVYEVPAKEEVGIPLLKDSSAVVWTADKYGKGGASFSDYIPRLGESDDESDDSSEDVAAPVVPSELLSEVKSVVEKFDGDTPSRLHLDGWSRARFEAVVDRIKSLKDKSPSIRFGYSVKTSPTDPELRCAKELGFFAECISQSEVKRALSFGFKSDEIILNGPGKFWPMTKPPELGLHMLFCDSLEEFERVVQIPAIAGCIGFRLRVPKVPSRFGVPLDKFENFQRLSLAIGKLKGKVPVGFHFHMPSWMIGVKRWRETFQTLLLWCHALERLTGVPIKILDLGGGFFPGDLETFDFEGIQTAVREQLPHVRELYFEPGRSLTQGSEILVSRVLDVRKGVEEDDPLEVVVDACIAELPLAQGFPHRIYFKNGDSGFVPLPKGKSRILGRICMEDDILSRDVEVPESVKIGDMVIFGDAGGYERSMSYGFGRG
jgi:diaminopimelate decarboxylase